MFDEKTSNWKEISKEQGNERIITNYYLRNKQIVQYKLLLDEQDDHLALIQVTHNQFINSDYPNEYENVIVKSHTFVNKDSNNYIITSINNNKTTITSDSSNYSNNIESSNNNNKTEKIEITIKDITPIAINSCFEKEIYFSIQLNNYFWGGDIEVSIASLYDKTQCFEKKTKKLITFIKRF